MYRWREADEAFEESFLEAEAEAWDRLLNAVKQEAMPHDVVIEEYGIATDRRGNPVMDLDTGLPRMLVTKRTVKRECNPALMMFLLKSHDPARYRERFDINHSGQVGITLDTLDAAIARLEAAESEGELPPADMPALPEGSPELVPDSNQRRYLRLDAAGWF